MGVHLNGLCPIVGPVLKMDVAGQQITRDNDIEAWNEISSSPAEVSSSSAS